MAPRVMRHRDHPSIMLGMVSLCRFHQNIHQGLFGPSRAKISRGNRARTHWGEAIPVKRNLLFAMVQVEKRRADRKGGVLDRPPKPSREPPRRHSIMPRDAAAPAVEAQMPAAWCQHRLD